MKKSKLFKLQPAEKKRGNCTFDGRFISSTILDEVIGRKGAKIMKEILKKKVKKVGPIDGRQVFMHAKSGRKIIIVDGYPDPKSKNKYICCMKLG